METQRHERRLLQLAISTALGLMLVLGIVSALRIGAGPLLAMATEEGAQRAAPASLASTASCWATLDGSTVYSSTDAGALQSAVTAAGTGDTVKVAGICAGVQNVEGFTQTLYITRSNITIQGGYTYTDWLADPDPDTYPTVLDAQGAGRVVFVPYSGGTKRDVTLDGFTLTGGDALNNSSGGCGPNSPLGGGGLCLASVDNFNIRNSHIYNNIAVDGGGINHHGGGDVILINTSVVSNTASTQGGGIYNRYNDLELRDSTVSGNDAGGSGGGIYISSHRLTLINSTISGNTSGDRGGGIYVYESWGSEPATIVASTIASNTAGFEGGGIYQNIATLTISNTLIAYNSDGGSTTPDCRGTLTSGGYNLIQDTTGCALTGTLTHVITGTDPLLGPLADNGGDTQTHLLLAGSPALDFIPAGTNGCGTAYTADQRGVARPQNGACDIGAVEVQPACYAEISGDDTTDFFSEDASAVQSALDALDPTSDTVKLSGTCAGVQTRSGATQTVYIDTALTLQGGYTHTSWLAAPNPDTYPTTLDAQDAGRVVYINGVSVSLDGLILTGGNAYGAGGAVNYSSSDHGGAIRMVNAILDLSNSTLYDNRAYYGGAIFSGGPVTLSNTLIISNSAAYRGGGIYGALSDYTLIASQVLSNSAVDGGGGLHFDYIGKTVIISESTVAYNQAQYGGGVSSMGAALVLVDSTVHDNSTASGSGGIYISWDGSLTATDSTFSGNTGAIHQTSAAGGITLTHSAIAANSGSPAGLNLAIRATLSNTILANDNGSNCGGSGLLLSGGYNLSSDSSCTLTATGDLTDTDPLLGPLADNGGSTLTHLPLPFSPAIDAVPPASCSLGTDQRGSARPVDGACDAGAVELAQEYAPVAATDAYTTTEERPLVVAAAGVLSNDLDGDWDPLTATEVAVAPTGGAVGLAAAGSFVYTPTLDFFGADSFTYVVSDGTLTDTATVSLTVTNVNDAPVADDDAFTVDEDSVDNVLDVLDGDSDADDDTLTVHAVGDPAHGTASDNDSDVLYTPDPDFYGIDVFTYTVADGHGSFDTATVTVTVSSVNDPPVADDDAFTVAEDSTANALDVLDGDSDVDGGTLTVHAVGDPAHGTATDNDTEVLYTPAPDFFGTDVFTYTVADGQGGFATATITVTVTNVNDPPVADDDAFTVDENSVDNVLDVLDGDNDADGDTLTVHAVGDPAHGIAVDNDTEVLYTPAPGFTGTDVFTYTVADGHGGFDTATVTVTVVDYKIYIPLVLR
ncbi:MAG: Ig-like domain-containing protein [Anaerolineales bacterium]